MYKNIGYGIVWVLLFTIGSEAKNCWKIKNNDTKRLCESKFEGKRNCWMIKNKDLQYYCEAATEGKQSCWKIKNRDDKEMCIAEMGH